MDPLSSVALTAVALAVWGYVTYIAVSAGVRKGIRDASRERMRENAISSHEDSGS